MAKKNPNSAEWMARCVDAAVAFSDGSRMRDANKDTPNWDMYITIPKFYGLKDEDAKEWNGIIREMFDTIGKPLLDSSAKNKGRVQYHIEGDGSFRSFEDTVLKLYDTPGIDVLTGGTASKWREALEEARPSLDAPDISNDIAKIAQLVKSRSDGVSADTLRIWEKVLQDTDIENSTLYPVVFAIANQAQDDELHNICEACAAKISEYRNSVRMKEENWLAKALAPLASPFCVLALKTDKEGNIPEFRNRGEYSEALLKRFFSDDAGKIRAQLEAVGVLSTKIFPVSAFRTNAVEPKVYSKDKEVTVSLSWLHHRFNWPLTNNILNYLEKDCNAVVTDSRKAGKKFPDPFGMETLNTQKAVIKASSEQDAKEMAASLSRILSVFYSPQKHPLSAKEVEVINSLKAASDLIAKRVNELKAEREAKSSSLIIEDRIVPYPAKCAVYVQMEEDKITPAIENAIDETLKAYPEWHMGKVAARDYTSFHLNSEYTKEGAGFAERYQVAEKLREEIKKATGKDFPVKYPNTGFNVEVSVRRMNAQDKLDKTEGIYIKLPLAMVQGGRQEEKALDDVDYIDTLDPVSKGLFELNESFGRNSRDKAFRTFVQKNSQLETYTNTWVYKLKETDDKEAKLAELKTQLEEKISNLFGEEAEFVHLDWLPDRDARKLKEFNTAINAFAKIWSDIPAEKAEPVMEMSY